MGTSASSTKQRIAASFSRHAATYDDFAAEQKIAAAELAACAGRGGELVAGPVLEIGCGTGFLSVQLAKIFAERDVEFSDLSAAMVSRCRQRIAAAGLARPSIRYGVLDGEALRVEDHYACIATSFALHWFASPQAGLRGMVRALRPAGRLLCAYPGADSYREWRVECQRQGAPCSANPLPVPEDIIELLAHEPVALRHWRRDIPLHFASAREFLHHLKGTGAGTPTAATVPLGPARMRALLRAWDRAGAGGVEVTCRVHFLAAQKED